MKKFLKYLSIPSYCILCKQQHTGKLAVCPACLDDFKQLENPCAICCLPMLDCETLICGQCIKSPPSFDKVWCGYTYEEPLRKLFHQYKFNQKIT